MYLFDGDDNRDIHNGKVCDKEGYFITLTHDDQLFIDDGDKIISTSGKFNIRTVNLPIDAIKLNDEYLIVDYDGSIVVYKNNTYVKSLTVANASVLDAKVIDDKVHMILVINGAYAVYSSETIYLSHGELEAHDYHISNWTYNKNVGMIAKDGKVNLQFVSTDLQYLSHVTYLENNIESTIYELDMFSDISDIFAFIDYKNIVIYLEDKKKAIIFLETGCKTIKNCNECYLSSNVIVMKIGQRYNILDKANNLMKLHSDLIPVKSN